MVRNALAFVGGVLWLHQLADLPPAWVALAAPAAAIAFARRPVLRVPCAVVIGFAWALLHAHVRLDRDLPTELEGANLDITGCVATLPERSANGVRFGLDVTASPPRVPPFVELTWYEPDRHVRPGECYVVQVRLRKRRGFANPGGFDYEAMLFARGVGATGYVRSLRPIESERGGLRYPITRARAALAERIDSALGDSPTLGIVKGLAIGDRQSVSREQWQTLAATGTSHLMAISGLHVGIVAALAAWCGRRLVRWRRAQTLRLTGQDAAAGAALFAAVVYAALAGFAVPTQRALAMLIVYLAARLARRRVRSPGLLAAAAVAVLLIDPFAPLSAGAWLSFAAVAAIFWGASGRALRSGRTIEFVRIQASVTVCLLPVLVSAFGQVSLVAPLANLLVIPLFSLLVVPLVLIGTLLIACSPAAGQLVLHGAAAVLGIVWPLLDWLAGLPLATLPIARLDPWTLAGLLVATWLALAPIPWPARATSLAVGIGLLTHTPPAPGPGTVELAVLDVGQGLAVVVRTRHHTLLYDTGPAFRSGRDTGELVVLPYLRSLGVARIDRLVATHGDLDHIGGLHSIASGTTVDRVYAGPSVVAAGLDALRCVRGMAWQWDGVRFRFLHPHGATATDGAWMARDHDNDSSCVLEIATGERRILLTGDIEAAAEQELVSQRLLEPATVVVAPHHGSRTSSSTAFVAATRPEFVVFSAGYRNRWGFPRPDVVERWRDAGARPLRTDDGGALILTIDRDGVQSLTEHRRVDRHYWGVP